MCSEAYQIKVLKNKNRSNLIKHFFLADILETISGVKPDLVCWEDRGRVHHSSTDWTAGWCRCWTCRVEFRPRRSPKASLCNRANRGTCRQHLNLSKQYVYVKKVYLKQSQLLEVALFYRAVRNVSISQKLGVFNLFVFLTEIFVWNGLWKFLT